MTTDPATFHKPVKRSGKRSKGCKHKKVWGVFVSGTGAYAVGISAPLFPGVKIEAERIEFCQGCCKFRVFGTDKLSSAWLPSNQFLPKCNGQTW